MKKGWTETVKGIVVRLGSGSTPEIKQVVKEIDALCKRHLEERFGELRGRQATRALEMVRDGCMRMYGSRKWQERYGGLRGLGALRFSCVLDKKIAELAGVLLTAIEDDEARVRLAAANALGGLKFLQGKQAQDAYVDAYFQLQDTFNMNAGGKQRSIGIALNLMTYPGLDNIMKARGYFPAANQAS
ncbi:MAG: HEAT repeat domain-containing protein [Candidatus Micrarchaeota archaeon]